MTDVTKIWPTTEVPEIEVGTLTLNRNPVDFFAEVEQLAFNVGSFVHGIGPSNDRMLLLRTYMYNDAQLHRIGPNFTQLEVNKPQHKPFNFNIDGSMANIKDTPVYYPNTLCPYATYLIKEGITPTNISYPNEFKCQAECGESENVKVGYFNNEDDDNYSQPKQYYLTMNHRERRHLAKNLAASLQSVLADKTEKGRRNCQQGPGYVWSCQ